MAGAECEFLCGDELSDRIRAVCAAPAVDCAVAFWGLDMQGHLFPRWRDGKVRIVCDISMGATCRRALKELGAPNNENLKVHDGLHSKIYLSAVGAVIGSANASDNGVGRKSGEKGKLLEAGVFCVPGSKAYVKAAEWFETLFKNATVVREAELLRAPERSGELIPRGLADVVDGLTLLRRLKDYPQNFQDLRVAIATIPLDENMAERSRNEREKERGIVSNRKDDVIFQDFSKDKFKAFNGYVLLFLRRSGVTTVHAYVNCSSWPQSKPNTIFGAANWGKLWKAIGQKPPERKLTNDESRHIDQFIEQNHGKWLFTPDEFAERLATLAA